MFFLSSELLCGLWTGSIDHWKDLIQKNNSLRIRLHYFSQELWREIKIILKKSTLFCSSQIQLQMETYCEDL